MNKENQTLKRTIIFGVIQGLTFAIIMALFDYIDKESFSFLQFLFYSIFFGSIMTTVINYNNKKQ